MKKIISGATLLAVFLPFAVYADSPCTNTELTITNETGQTLNVAAKPSKGKLEIGTSPIVNNESRTATMTKTVNGTGKGYVLLTFPDGSEFKVNYDYHILPYAPWECSKSIRDASGSATSNYKQSVSGSENSGNSRTVKISSK